MPTKKFIYCTFDLEGFHRYEEAEIEIYLQNCHRHMFRFKCQIEVIGTNREVEFILLRRELMMFLLYKYQEKGTALLRLQFNNMSCEDIANSIVVFLKTKLGEDRTIIVEVSEDGENGAEVMWIPEPKKEHVH